LGGRAVAAFVLACVVACACAAIAHAGAPDSTRTAAESPEPPRAVFVNRILFTGNKSVSANELRVRMKTREPSFFSVFRKPVLDERQVRRDVAALQAYYHSIGYPEPSCTWTGSS